KDSSGGISQLIDLTSMTHKPILCGDNYYFYAALCSGAKGGILASSSLQTNRFVEVYEFMQEECFTEARAVFATLTPLIKLLYRETNPAPIKWLLEKDGSIQSGTLRLPLTSIS